LAVLPPGTCTVTPYEEIEARHRDHPWFKELSGTWLDEAIRRDPCAVYYAPSGVNIDGDLDLDQADCEFLFVNGDLKVTGLLRNLDSSQGVHLAVAGDLEVGAVIAGGSVIHVAGDLHAGRFVYGHYKDGCLSVAGQVRTPYWISYDHDMRAGRGFVGDTIELHSNDGTFQPDYDGYESVSLCSPGDDVVPLATSVYTSGTRFDPLLLYEHLGAGRSVLRPWRDWGSAHVLVRQWVVASHANGWNGRPFVDDTQVLLDKLAELRFETPAVVAHIRGDLLYAIKELVARGSGDPRVVELWARQVRIAVDTLPPAPTAKLVHEFEDDEQDALDFCRNGLNEYSWYVYDKADVRAAAEAAQILQRVLPWLVTWSNAWHSADTLVRLLLKLDRAPEAYAIVASILARYPEEPLFADLAASAGYREWTHG